MNFKAGLSNRLVSLSAAVVVLFLSVFASTVNAQTFNVETAAELRDALENAAANSEDDVIILAKGTYYTTDGGIGTFRFLGSTAHNLTIQAAAGLTAADVILDGANTDQVLRYTNTMVTTLTLDRISVIRGKGAGVFALNSNNLIVTGCNISNNISDYPSSNMGGGIYAGGSATVTDSRISDNKVSATGDSQGGGIFAWGAVTVTGSMISGNEVSTTTNSSAYSAAGGGIRGGSVTVIDSTISGNKAISSYSSYGGGIYGVIAVTVTNSTISGNTASSALGNSSYGGGIYGGGAITVTNSTITVNTSSAFAPSYGGGIYGVGAVTVTDSTISHNEAHSSNPYNVTNYSEGGGIYGGGAVTITNSTISENTAYSSDFPAFGGGIYGGGAVTVTNSTISGNMAVAVAGQSYGGGIYGGGIFVNNIFKDNSSDICFTGDSYVYYNYIDSITKLQNEFGPGIHVYKFENIPPSAGSPIFIDTSFRIYHGSVAIDAGLDPGSALFAGLFTYQATLQAVRNALVTDKDGNPRIVDGVIDLGAYEYSNNNLRISYGVPSGTVISHPPAINCGSGSTDCFAYFPSSTSVSLEATPDVGGAIFSAWSGALDCDDGQVTVDKPVTCIASFTQCTDIASLGVLGVYNSIGEALLMAPLLPSVVIDIIGSNQQETLNFGRLGTITLNGGYDCAFNEPPLLMTTITGSVTVTKGTITFNNIIIR